MSSRSGLDALVVAPHPDDETLGCGGTIAAHRLRGDSVAVVWLTAGEQGIPGLSPSEAGIRRRTEAMAAIAELGVTDGRFLDLPDGGLRDCIDAATRLLASIIEDRRPNLIYAPHRDEAHRDHAAAAAITIAASQRCHGIEAELLGYEVWSPVAWPHHSEDVTEVFDKKLAALACYRSQLDQVPYERMATGLGRYRGAMTTGCERAESFVALTWRSDA